MGRISGSLIIASGLALSIGLEIAANAQAPSKLLGIDASGYGQYDPDVAVGAGLPSQTGQNGNCLTTTGTALSWGACGSGGGAALSDNTPKPDGTAAAGTDTEGSRSDHVHQLNPDIAANKARGTTNATDIQTLNVQVQNAIPRLVPIPGTAENGDVLTLDSTIPGADFGWKPLPAENTAYKFFAQETLAVPTVTTDTTISGSGAGYTFTLLPKKEFTEGLIVGPFHTFYEGRVVITLARTQTVAMTLSVQHDFGSNRVLTTTQTEHFRVNKNDAVSIALTDFSSVTRLAHGNITLDNSSTLNVTDAVLAAPVSITITAEITVAEDGTRRGGTMTALTGEDNKVTFWQLETVTGGGGGGGGASAFIDLSDTPSAYTGQGGKFLAVNSGASAVEFVDKPSGGGGASLSDATPKADGTAAAGTSTNASRGDHVHPVDAQIAANKAQGTTNRDNIQINAGAIATNKSSIDAIPARRSPYETIPEHVGTGKSGVSDAYARGDHAHSLSTDLAGRQNPALSSASAGHLVRQKSDHSAYETVEPHAAVLSGLPAITGHAGDVLTVNTLASGVEWKAAGGGGGGGGGAIGVTAQELVSSTFGNSNSNAGNQWAISLSGTALQNVVRFLQSSDLRYMVASLSKAGETFYSSRLDFTDTVECISGINTWGAPFGVAGGPPGSIAKIPTSDNRGRGRGWTLGFNVQSTDCSSTRNQSFTIDNFMGSQLAGWTFKVTGYTYTGGGGGGGDTPNLPDPSAAGAGQFLRVNSGGSAYELAAVTQGHPFAVPGDITAVKSGSNIVGTSARVSRADHAHAIQSSLYGTPVAIGTANAAGSATTLARSDHVHSQGNGVATRGQLDDVQDQVDSLNGLTADLILGSPGPITWADVNSDNSEGGVARGATAGADVDAAAALTYSPEITGNRTFAIVRIPATKDPRSYRTVDATELTLRYSLSVERLIGTKAGWTYYEYPTRLDSTETLTLQISGRKLGATTFDGQLGPDAAASLVDHNDLLWTATNTATQWATGNVAVADGVASKIYNAMRARDEYKFSRLEMEVAYVHTVNSVRNVSKALIPMPLHRRGGIDNNSITILSGNGRLGNATIHAHMNLPVANDATTSESKMTIGNCGWCQGTEMITIHLYGVN